MRSIKPLLCSMLFTFCVYSATLVAQDAPKSYPITFAADDIHTIANLAIDTNGLKINGKSISLLPIRCEAGVTGAMIIGNGTYTYDSRDGEYQTSGKFRAAMLRFNPTDQESLVKLSGDTTTDHAIHEMTKHMLDNVFRHCWHAGREALLPDKGSFVANVYSTTQGDLLISTGPVSNVVHSFTDNKTLAMEK